MSIKVERWSEESAPNAEKLRRRLESEGYSVFQWSDRAGAVYTPHTHAEDQSHWIIKGALELSVGGERYVLHAGDRDFLPAHTEHAAFVPGTEPVVYLVGVKN